MSKNYCYLTSTVFFIAMFTFVLSFASPPPLQARSKWVKDIKSNFKIKVPSNYQKNRLVDGTDNVNVFVSPDQNAAVRIRSIPVNANVSVDNIIQAFEQNILKGSQRLLIQNHTLNRYYGKLCGYKWRFNNTPVVAAAFYTIQNNIAYVVWSLIPENLFKQRTAETDAIINTFTILKSQIKPTPKKSGGLFGSMSNTSSNNQSQNNSKHHQKKHRKKYFDLVSDDAKISHKVPVGFKIANKTEGQSIWKNHSGIKMVVQTIKKQKGLKAYMKSVISDIKSNGATVLSNEYTFENGLMVDNYSYKFKNTIFCYGATESNNVYYLVGFVGNISDRKTIENYSEVTNMSLKKAY